MSLSFALCDVQQDELRAAQSGIENAWHTLNEMLERGEANALTVDTLTVELGAALVRVEAIHDLMTQTVNYWKMAKAGRQGSCSDVTETSHKEKPPSRSRRSPHHCQKSLTAGTSNIVCQSEETQIPDTVAARHSEMKRKFLQHHKRLAAVALSSEDVYSPLPHLDQKEQAAVQLSLFYTNCTGLLFHCPESYTKQTAVAFSRHLHVVQSLPSFITPFTYPGSLAGNFSHLSFASAASIVQNAGGN